LHRFTAEAPYRGDLMTHRVLFNPQLHTTEMFQVMVEALEHRCGVVDAWKPMSSVNATTRSSALR